MLDADGSADPAEIPRFVAALEAGADFAKGSRYLRGRRQRRHHPTCAASATPVLSGTANLLHGTHFTDLCYGYNAFWARCLPFISLDVPGFEVETLINLRIAGAGMKITEVPSYEEERISGREQPEDLPRRLPRPRHDPQRVAPAAQHPRRARATGAAAEAKRPTPPPPLPDGKPLPCPPTPARCRDAATVKGVDADATATSATWRRSSSPPASACWSARSPTRSRGPTHAPSPLLFWAGVLLLALPIFYRLTAARPRPANGSSSSACSASPSTRQGLPRRAALHLLRRAGPRLQRQPDRRPPPPLPQQPDPRGDPVLPGPGGRRLGADEADRALRYTAGVILVGAARLVLIAALFLLFQRVSGSARVAGPRRRDLRRQLQLPLLGRPVLLRVAGAAAAADADDGAGRARSGAEAGAAGLGACRSCWRWRRSSSPTTSPPTRRRRPPRPLARLLVRAPQTGARPTPGASPSSAPSWRSAWLLSSSPAPPSATSRRC